MNGIANQSNLTAHEKVAILRELKRAAGSHSPSRSEMLKAFGQDPVKIDACFLSNPYATELVRDRFTRAMRNTSMEELIEAYPPGQNLLLEWMSSLEGIEPKNSIVCNGAVQAIEWLMNEIQYDTVLIPFPTFSTYYEALPNDRRLVKHYLKSEEGFALHADRLIDQCREESVGLLVLVNPNNPTGLAITPQFIEKVATELPDTKIIVDESFIHFSRNYEDWRKWRSSAADRFPAIFFVKSLSKDYGMAGFRVGYLEGTGSEVRALKSRYGTWNINNFAALCLREISKPDFAVAYEEARKRYNKDMFEFTVSLNNIENINTFPTDANFVLIRIPNCSDGFHVVATMLAEHGVYVRTMEDKIGLDHSYLRIAGRTAIENEKIIFALSACTT